MKTFRTNFAFLEVRKLIPLYLQILRKEAEFVRWILLTCKFPLTNSSYSLCNSKRVLEKGPKFTKHQSKLLQISSKNGSQLLRCLISQHGKYLQTLIEMSHIHSHFNCIRSHVHSSFSRQISVFHIE